MVEMETLVSPNLTSLDLWPHGLGVSHTVHVLIGIYVCVAGVSGTVSNMTLLAIHWLLRDRLLDPTGFLLCNFLLMNFGMSILQFPFAASSSFAGRWLYEDAGCQLYGAAGFFLGIGVVFSLGLVILEGFMIIHGLAPVPRQGRHSLVMVAVSWAALLCFVLPPYLDIFGRFGLEPSGTACTIDYWHGNYRNYNYYVLYLTTMAYMLPISVMLVLFLRSVQQIQEKEATLGWSITFMEHQAAVTKVC